MRNDLQNFSTTLQQWRTIVVVIKGSPDPDALAAAYAVRLFAETLGVKVRIIAPERLSLPQNRTFVRLLGIPLKLHANPAGWRRKADAYGVVDHQSAAVSGLEGIPCVFHLDHHQSLVDGIQPAFRLVEQTAGATCTILARLFSGLRTPLDSGRMRAAFAADDEGFYRAKGIVLTNEGWTHVEWSAGRLELEPSPPAASSSLVMIWNPGQPSPVADRLRRLQLPV